jgi:hypothetical protein
MPVTLKSHNLDDLKVGMRVQSFSTRNNGEIAMVDVESGVVWIKWNVTGSIIPHPHKKLDDVYTIDS